MKTCTPVPCPSFQDARLEVTSTSQREQMTDASDLENRFTYHVPKPGQSELYQEIRSMALDFASLVTLNTPVSREASLALMKIEEAVFWANAAIARHGD